MILTIFKCNQTHTHVITVKHVHVYYRPYCLTIPILDVKISRKGTFPYVTIRKMTMDVVI